jgi:FKBP-type peptidyl-prolyl cis-trans isomerase FkpA
MRRSSLLLTTLACVCILCAACSGSTTGPSNDVPFSQTDLRTGTGATADFGRSLSVNYTGWLYDASQTDGKGVIFDTNAGGAPFTFTLGAGQVIRGWEQGVSGMKAGGVRRLVIPSSLAYGATRHGSIPPSATLVFEIELLGVQ